MAKRGDWEITDTVEIKRAETAKKSVIFATAPKVEEEKKDETPDDEKVSVDIWHWQDPQMMPQQLMQAATERNRTFDAIYDVASGTVVQLENPHMRSVTIGAKGDGDTRKMPALVFCFNRDECWNIAEQLKGLPLVPEALPPAGT